MLNVHYEAAVGMIKTEILYQASTAYWYPAIVKITATATNKQKYNNNKYKTTTTTTIKTAAAAETKEEDDEEEARKQINGWDKDKEKHETRRKADAKRQMLQPIWRQRPMCITPPTPTA